MNDKGNPYMVMPLERVRADALHGVTAACEAWRILAPADAGRELGQVIEPGREQERADRTRQVLSAAGDYQKRNAGKRGHGHKVLFRKDK